MAEEEVLLERPQLFVAFTVLRVVSTLMIAVWLCIWLLELSSMIESRNSNLSKTTRRSKLFLFLNSCSNLMSFMAVCIMAWHSSLTPLGCSALDRVSVICYCLTMQFTFLFLLEKANAVGKYEKDDFYRFVSFWCRIAVWTFIPAFLIPVVITTINGQLSPEGLCIQWIQAWCAWLFAGASFIIAFTLVYLFVRPIMNSVAITSERQNVELLIAIAKRDSWLALSACFVTCVACCASAATTVIADRNGAEYDFYRVIGLTIFAFDMFFISCCCRMMTSVWAPSCLSCHSSNSHKHSAPMVTASSTTAFASSSVFVVDPIPVTAEARLKQVPENEIVST